MPESKSPNKGGASHAVRSGGNFLVQSGASDINLLGVIDLIDWIQDNGYENDIYNKNKNRIKNGDGD